MGAIQTGSTKVLTEGKGTARIGDGVLITAAEVAAALGSKAKPPTAPKNTGVASDAPLPPSAGGAGGSYEPTMDYNGNLQEGVPGSAIIDLDRSEGSTYGTLQDYVNLFTSAGLVTGGEMSNAAAGSIEVASGTVLLRTEDDDISAVRFYNFEGNTFPIPADDETHYIGVRLYDGVARVVANTTFDSFDKDTGIPLGSAVNINGSVFFLNNPYKTSDLDTNIIQRLDALAPTLRDAAIGGLELSETTGRVVHLSPGKIWARVSDFEIPAKASNVNGMLTAYWNGTAIQFGGTTTWDNSKYNDVDTGQLLTLPDNRYGCLWFYIAPQSQVFGFAYGRFPHTSEADAALEQPPTYLTAGFKSQTLFLGRLIFRKGASTAESITSAFAINLPLTSEDNAKVTTFYSSTGLITGGNLTVNGSNNQTFDVSAGTAVFVDYNVPGSPTQITVEFGPFTGVSVPGIGTRLTTYIGIDTDGQIVQQATPFTNTQRRTIATLGLVVHSNLVNINTTNIIAATVHSPTNQLHDFMEAVGALNIFGNVYGANTATLNINKTSGRIFKLGINFQTNNLDPHGFDIGAQTGLTFRYRTQTGVESANTVNIDPNNYDVGGVVTDISPALRWTIQRIAMFQSGLTRIQYGQNLYGTLAEAEAALNTESFITESNIAENGIIRAYLIIQDGCTSLLDTTKCKFVAATKFGGTAAGGVTVSSTDQLPEGATNFYFTEARARAAVANGTITGNVVISGTATVGGIEVGFRGVPITDQNANYVFAVGDRGRARRKTDTGTYTYTVNNAIHSTGDVLCAINFGSATNLTLVGNGVSLQLGGTTSVGSRTVAPGGVAYIYMQSATVGIVSGPGVS